jgi:hypothetical protein
MGIPYLHPIIQQHMVQRAWGRKGAIATFARIGQIMHAQAVKVIFVTDLAVRTSTGRNMGMEVAL